MSPTVRRLRMLAGMLLVWIVGSAHVGTNQVVLEGRAGGYLLRVMLDPAGVIPSQVPIIVRVLEGSPTRVTIRAAQWNIGTRGAPPPEDATPVPGDPGVWSHSVWIMTSSTYSVHVAVKGPAGNGTLIVPLQTSATATLGMDRGMGALLLVLGALLVAGVLSIVGAAAREGSLEPGVVPTDARRRTARTAMAAAAGVMALALVGGSKWWSIEEGAYRRRLYRPMSIATSIRTLDAQRMLTIVVTDSLWRTNRLPPLMPDHGKLLHLFLIRDGEQDAIAHLHPLRVHPDSFVTRIPPIPSGRYLLYGDFLLQSGAQRTVVDTVDMPVAPVVADESSSPRANVADASATTFTSAFADADDSWGVVTAHAIGERAPLVSGGSLTLTSDTPIAAKRDLRLLVTMRDDRGTVVATEPYMGMGGHVMVLRQDAGVFLHLHPLGTASATAQLQLMRRERGDTARLDSASLAAVIGAAEHAAMPHEMQPAPVAFPFAFPSVGAYRVFVQVKRAGRIETVAFDVSVP